MKITKEQLKQIIKEEIEKIAEAGESTWQTDPGLQAWLDKIRTAWRKQIPGITDENLNVVIASLDPLVSSHTGGPAQALKDYLANMGVPEEEVGTTGQAAVPTGPGTQKTTT